MACKSNSMLTPHIHWKVQPKIILAMVQNLMPIMAYLALKIASFSFAADFQCPTSHEIELFQGYEVASSNRKLFQSLTFKHAQYFQFRQVAKAFRDHFQCPTSCKMELLEGYEVAYSNRELLQSLAFRHVQHFQFSQVAKAFRDPFQCPTCPKT